MKYQENEVIDLAEVFRLLISKLWLIILAVIIGGAGAFGFSKYALPLEYSSHISLYIQCYTTFNENPDYNYNNISTSKQLIKTYIEVLKDDAVMGAVGEHLTQSFDETTLRNCFGYTTNGTISSASIRSCLNITSVTDTSALSLSATTKNAEVAAAVCNIIADVAPDFIKEAVGAGSISTIDVAKVYPAPVAPNNTKNAMLGAIGAAAIVIFIIFLRYILDTTVKDSVALSHRYNKAIIGEIQKYGSKKKTDGDEHMKLTDEGMTFGIIESYKSIRTNVSFALSPFDKKVFIVSSSNPAEGKSTIASNISIAMAQGGSKVLLIDADLRKPVQHKIFQLGNKVGLSSAVGKMNSLDECISKDVMENLDVMTSGPIPPNPSELLASEYMSVILNQLQSRYNMIIIDTPPVNVVTDAMGLAKDVSGIILALRYGKTKMDDIDTIMNKIEFARMNVLGFVMNEVVSKHGGKYYARDSYHYEYVDKEHLNSKKNSEKADSKKKAGK